MSSRVLSTSARGVRGGLLHAALLASTALTVTGHPASAQDATWRTNPGSNNFNASANWSTNVLPTGTASFGASSRTNLSFGNDVSIGGWTFNADAASYTFTNARVLEFNGAGIVVNGGSATINNSGEISFINGSTAGTATFNNNFFLTFYGTSNAGSAAINNNSYLLFYDGSTAGNATITNNSGADLQFYNTSTAGNAVITNNGTQYFYDDSSADNASITNNANLYFLSGTATAGNASITNSDGAFLQFWGSFVTAGTADITNSGELSFYGSSAGSATITNRSGASAVFDSLATAGNAAITNSGDLHFTAFSDAGAATITTEAGGVTRFSQNSSGWDARFITNAGGTFDISGLAASWPRTSAGSIEGAGDYFLGANELTVGSNNLSTEVSGVIADGGLSGGTGGSLVKTGTGTLTLSGTNTYTGGTRIAGGTLQIGNGGETGSIIGNVVNNGVLAFNRDILTFGGDISGSGVVQQIGTGTTILSGTNTYTGGTTISGGTLQIGNGGATGSIVGNVANDGVLAFNRDALTFAGDISGSGAVRQIGMGTTILSGANSYTGGTTVDGGTLRADSAGAFVANTAYGVNGGTLDLNGYALTMSSLSGTGGAIALGGADLTIDQASNTIYGGSFSGSGDLVKQGAGTLKLAGAGNSVGAVAVSGGTLEFGQPGTFTAASYTTGSGASTTIDATAQLDVTGAFTQSAGSTLNVTIGANDPAVTAATASLAGILNVAGYTGTQFTVIRTTGGITGDFAGISIGGSSSPVDYLTAVGGISGNDYTVHTDLTWNAGTAQGNGVFTLADASETFDVGVALMDQTGPFASGWDGRSLAKEGNGTLTLSAMNTYTGATAINGGTLAIAATGGITSDVTNNATFENAGTVAGRVTNNAGAIFTQTGGAVSGGVINYGTVNANGGALNGAIANNAGGIFNVGSVVTGNGTFDNANGATLAVAATGDYTLTGLLTNSGVVAVAAGGSLTASGGLLNNVGGVITNNGTLTDALNNAGLVTNNGTYNADVASNTGTINNTAGAIWNGNVNTAGTVNNDGTINGSLTQTAGTTTNNGIITGAVTIAGGLFTGTGSYGGLTVNGGATVAPGVGTMSVAGNVTFNAGSIYQVAVDAAGQGSRINATGTVAINGGAVNVLARSGSYGPSTTYTIVNATGGVTGAYAGVTANFAFLTPSLTYDANNVFLTLALQQSNTTGFLMSAYTPNQKAVGAALNQSFATATGDYATVIGALAGLSAFQGPAMLNAISGEQYADFGTMNTNNSAMFMNAVSQQMAVARGAVASSGQRAALAQDCDVAACDAASPFSVWGSGLGGFGAVAGDDNASTATYSSFGAAVGVDYRVGPRFLVGLATAYTSGSLWVNSFPGRGWTNSVVVAAYSSFTQGGFYADLLGGYGWFSNQLQRQISISGLQPLTATGSTNANQAMGQIETGYRIGVYAPAGATVAPFARLQGSSVSQNGFSENGAQSLSLNVQQQTTSSLRTLFGADLTAAVPLGSDRSVDLGLRLGWQHEFASTSRPITASLSGAPFTAFTVYGATPRRDAAVVSLRGSTAIAAGTQLYLRYDGEVGGGTDNHAFNLGVRVSW